MCDLSLTMSNFVIFQTIPSKPNNLVAFKVPNKILHITDNCEIEYKLFLANTV